MGFTLIVAHTIGVLDSRYPQIERYVGLRPEARPALQKAAG